MKSLKEFDGTEEFKEWIKLFNVQMVTYDNSTKLVTLKRYLSNQIMVMLASLNLNISSDFHTLCNFLSQEYKKAEKSIRAALAELTEVIQAEEEAVVTFSARLESKVKDLNFTMPPKDLKELFLGGLEPELQKMVRNKLKGSEDFSDTVNLAKKQEIELGKIKAAEKLRKQEYIALKTNRSFCRECGSTAPIGKSLCSQCFRESRNKVNNNNSTQNSNSVMNKNNNNNNNSNGNNNSANNNPVRNATEFKICPKCNVNVATPTKKYCNSCYLNIKNNNQTKSSEKQDQNQSNSGKIEFSKTSVKFIDCDNSSENSLLWNHEKLKEQNKCFYCANSLQSHDKSKPPCKDIFKNYKAQEVRHLLFKKIDPPVRDSIPTGPPKSP